MACSDERRFECAACHQLSAHAEHSQYSGKGPVSFSSAFLELLLVLAQVLAALPLERPGADGAAHAQHRAGSRLQLALRRGSGAAISAGVGTLLLEDASGHCLPCVRPAFSVGWSV